MFFLFLFNGVTAVRLTVVVVELPQMPRGALEVRMEDDDLVAVGAWV